MQIIFSTLLLYFDLQYQEGRGCWTVIYVGTHSFINIYFSIPDVQGAPHILGHFLNCKQMNIKSSILKILLNFKNWQAYDY